MSIIEINDLSKVYNPGKKGQVEAIRRISCDIEEGEFFTIVGPTGCGKSTLLQILAGLTRPTEGAVKIEDTVVTEPTEYTGVVFQEDSSLPWRTTLENVEFGLEMEGVGKETRRQRSREMIDLVGLAGFEDNYPNELSGGMRQRVAIARTLAMDPDIILMDEPFGALDEQTRLILGEELLDIHRNTNQTVVFITHSLTEAVHLSDRVLAMTSRPGAIKTIIDIDLARPRDSDIITTDRFNRIVDELWEALRDEALEGLTQKRGG